MNKTTYEMIALRINDSYGLIIDKEPVTDYNHFSWKIAEEAYVLKAIQHKIGNVAIKGVVSLSETGWKFHVSDILNASRMQYLLPLDKMILVRNLGLANIYTLKG